MENANMSEAQLKELMEVAQRQINTCKTALESAHKRYLNPRDDADFVQARKDMSLWDAREWTAIGELEELKKELEGRVVASKRI